MNVSIKVALFESKECVEPIYSSENIQTTVREDEQTSVCVPVQHLAKISSAVITITHPKQNDPMPQDFGLVLIDNVFSCLRPQESDDVHRFFPWWYFFISPVEEAVHSSELSPKLCFSTSYSTVICAKQVCATISKQDGERCLLCFGSTKKHCQEAIESLSKFDEPFCLEIVLNALDRVKADKTTRVKR